MPSRAAIAATVRRLFAAAGDVARPATLTRLDPGAYDPAAGAPAAAAEASTAGLALFDAAVRPRFGGAEGLTVEPPEELIWLAGLGFAPRPGDALTIDGTTRVVRDARNVAGAGALYAVAAR